MAKSFDADDIYDLWDRIDSSLDLDEYSPSEQREIHELVSQIAEDAINGHDVYDSDAFWDFLDLTGLDAEDFPWEEFREWYSSL